MIMETWKAEEAKTAPKAQYEKMHWQLGHGNRESMVRILDGAKRVYSRQELEELMGNCS